MAFSGHPILNEIKGGFKLKPTKTVDKSKPIFLAEGEVADFTAATDKSKNLENIPAPVVPAPKATSPRPSWKDKKVEAPAPAPDFPGVGAGGVPPPPPPPPGGFGGAPPPPPPPPEGFAPPPPPPAPVVKKPANPKLLQLGGNAASSDEDRGALLKSIQGGLRLRKTVTNDKSGLVVDDDLRQSSVKRCEPTGPPPELLTIKPKASPTGRKGQLTPNTLSPKGISDDERYLTPDEREYSDYGTPEPEEDERPRSKWSRTPEPKESKKIDYAFDEKNLKVTAETLKEEIPTGLAAKMAAKWLQAENVDGGATLPRPNFRASPRRSVSPFNEVNNNMEKPTLEQLKVKAPSKWVVVETGLKRPGQGNVPLDKSREATPRATTPRPYRDRTGSNLDAPIFDRARTASPTLEFNSSRRRSSARESSPEIEVEPEPVVAPTPKRLPLTKKTEPVVVEKKKEPVTARKVEPKGEPKVEIKAEEPATKTTARRTSAAKSESKTGTTASKKLDTPLTVKTDVPSPSSAASKLTSPLSINTDFASPSRKTITTKPEIKETPPTPKHTQKTNGYSYRKPERSASPPPAHEPAPSPVSSMSSASVPSPSSISPGSTSPEQLPKRSRPINPNFDKMKEKFVSGDVSNATPSGSKLERPNKIGNISVKDSVFNRSSASPRRDSVTPTADEAAAVKKAVKEAAAKRVISVPISAPWHTPRDSYSSVYSPSYSSRDSFSPSFSPSYTSSRRNFDYPSSLRDTSSWRSSPTRTSVDMPYTSKYSSMSPDDFRRNYRFNIDLASDSPLSLSRR